MATDTVTPPLTANQMSIVLNDIANCASAIQRFAICQAALQDSDYRDLEAARHAIETLAERIGLLADGAADGLGKGSAVIGPRVEDWFMPPAYRDDM